MNHAPVDLAKNIRLVMANWHDVAIGIITDAHNEHVLITKRAENSPYAGGLWEFPGGKLEVFESPDAALIREIKEEIGLNITRYSLINCIDHVYSTHNVRLWVYHVFAFTGEPLCLESQTDMCWASFEKLDEFSFPAANQEMIDLFFKYLNLANA